MSKTEVFQTEVHTRMGYHAGHGLHML